MTKTKANPTATAPKKTYRDLAFERLWDTLAQAAGGVLPWHGTTMQALESLMANIDTAMNATKGVAAVLDQPVVDTPDREAGRKLVTALNDLYPAMQRVERALVEVERLHWESEEEEPDGQQTDAERRRF
jgi:hypothetical protein